MFVRRSQRNHGFDRPTLKDVFLCSPTRTPEIPAEILAEMTPALRAFVEGLLLVNIALHAQIEKMQAENDELKSQVKRLTPQNSSLPPSTQHPHARPTPKPKPKSKKTWGGQSGHKRTIRELVPIERCEQVERCDQVITAVPWKEPGSYDDARGAGIAWHHAELANSEPISRRHQPSSPSTNEYASRISFH